MISHCQIGKHPLSLPMTKKKRILIVLAVVLCSSLIGYLMYDYGCFLPSWVEWTNSTAEIGTYQIQLKNRHVYLTDEENEEIQQLNQKWYIAQMQVGDIDNDGEEDILLLAWNRQNFGDYHPIWEENDTFHFFEHLYIYNIKNGALYHKWMSSQLLPRIKSFTVNEDGTIDLIAENDEKSKWAWIEWGIERID